jgi:flagellar biosynthesis anti-sigma factor FlgM
MSVDRVNISNKALDSTLRPQGTEESRRAKDTQQTRVSYGDDALVLSDTAKNVERLTQVIERSRADRFAQVRQALEAGTYRVSSQDIAMKLIDSNSR